MELEVRLLWLLRAISRSSKGLPLYRLRDLVPLVVSYLAVGKLLT